MSVSPHILVVLGPTASGKSDFAIDLALKHNGEVISADSRQVYKGLDIGTGKVTKEEMKDVPHHMLSVYNLDEEIGVARYARDTIPIIDDILRRGKTPIICGGTGQYIDALIYNTLLPQVPPNKKLREELEKLPSEELFKKLEEKDAIRATSIDKHNRVRVIRALEILDTLSVVPPKTSSKLKYDTELYLMSASRPLLRTRIIRRLEKRLTSGMIDEVKNIMTQGYTSDSMRKFGLEYVGIGKFLEGTFAEEEMKQDIITKSCQYAKRQRTWNKKYLSFAKIVEVKE